MEIKTKNVIPTNVKIKKISESNGVEISTQESSNVTDKKAIIPTNIKLDNISESTKEKTIIIGAVIQHHNIEENKIPDNHTMTAFQLKYYNDIVILANKSGFKIISGEYKNKNSFITFMCPSGHVKTKEARMFKRKQTCSICASKSLKSSTIAKNNFYENVKKIGFTVVGEYKASNIAVECKCKNGHEIKIIPQNLRIGFYPKCKQCPKTTKILLSDEEINEKFTTNINKMGGKVLGKCIGQMIRVPCICPEGHECNPVPYYILKGREMCKYCSKNSPERAFEEFRQIVEKQKGIIVGRYINVNTRVDCICSEGHGCRPIPRRARVKGNICKKCTKICPIEAKNYFMEKIQKMGGIVTGEYINTSTRVECLCPIGHKCYPTPNVIKAGQGMCRRCTGRCPIEAENNFIQNVEKLGGIIIGKYINTHTPVECICANNHKCKAVPGSLRDGLGMCKKCSNVCPEQSEQIFINRIKELGGTIIGEYKNSSTAVECVCINGHNYDAIPAHVKQGYGRCKKCPRKTRSHGEELVSEALKSLNIEYEEQVVCSPLKRLYFDFMFKIDNKIYFIEADGKQHFEEINFFHRTSTAFFECRQRDLVKNCIVDMVPNSKLIRIDYMLTDDRSVARRAGIIVKLSEHIKNCMKSENNLIADEKLYTWLHDTPEKETMNKYTEGDFQDYFEDSDDYDEIDDLFGLELVDYSSESDDFLDDESESM